MADVRIHAPEYKSSWALAPVKAGMRTLIIADSNGLSMSHTELPRGCTLDVFRGAGIQHVPSLLRQATDHLAADLSTVVLAVGLNNRLSSFSDFITHLRDIREWAARNNKKLVFSAIPVLPSLPSSTKDAIFHLNDLAQDTVELYVDTVAEDDIQLVPHDSSSLHYDTKTAQVVVSKIFNFLNQ